ncbi:MAG: Soluble epoxide hydrolase [Deltaproteobacteria bacterium ADurb.Bin207]|jgi:pimeloyl-ACP methyl ester carboxylesterase|nr:MAG: Soluble epoxide hydrolase [Deltaproteobacteria bacterium ADurb.Bin207]HPB97500.1 alpha/beta hydrolase [Polyangiaceae bacterium]HPY19272.1 alpha/beta hydrolase [Polyangiaceae bacterium]
MSILGMSAVFHRSIQPLTRHLGGRHGQIPAHPLSSPDSYSVAARDLSFHILEWTGSDPPLVFFHGLNNNAWSWARVASLFAPKRRILALDSRGHGHTAAPASGYSLEDTTQDIKAVFDTLGLDTVDLAGHSWGGKVAMHFTCTHPTRVHRLALADPVPPAGFNRLLQAFPGLISLALRAERGPFPNHQAWEKAGKRLVYLQPWDAWDQKLWSAAFRQTAHGAYHHVLPESAFQEIILHALQQDITDKLGALRMPVLLMRPTLTLSFFPGELRSFRKALPHRIEKRIAGDHTFIHTNPFDTHDILQKFFS